jgi:hypothetical protein
MSTTAHCIDIKVIVGSQNIVFLLLLNDHSFFIQQQLPFHG